MGRSVPILTYHHVNPMPGEMITVTPDHFEQQMAFLLRERYRSLFIDELLDWMGGRMVLNQKAVVLTFDDGYRDNYRFAFSILKEYGMKATVFLVTGWADADRGERKEPRLFSHQECRRLAERGEAARMALSWEEAREMETSGLIRIESHTHHHQKNLFADSASLRESLRLSQEAFQRHLGKKSACLCWPGGRYNKESLEIAGQLGFRSCCTTERGVNVSGQDPFRLKRITVKDAGAGWLRKTLFIFSRPRIGAFYARLKPN